MPKRSGAMKRPELLAPAGDFEKMRMAIHYGADAVYLGDPRFSLRNKAKNFGAEELASAVAYAHERNVRVYTTVNIFARNTDLPAIRNHVALLREISPDAVIISDPGIFTLFRERAPEIDIHV
jgi:U32 family peptidase